MPSVEDRVHIIRGTKKVLIGHQIGAVPARAPSSKQIVSAYSPLVTADKDIERLGLVVPSTLELKKVVSSS